MVFPLTRVQTTWSPSFGT